MVAILLKGISPNGEIIVEQHYNRPHVYFDNWFYQVIIKDEGLKNDVVKIMLKKGATLSLSPISLYEILNREDKRQISLIADFIDNFDTAFIRNEPISVVKKEVLFKQGRLFSSPIACEELITLLVSKSKRPFKSFNVSEVITLMGDEIRDTGYKFKRHFEGEIDVIFDGFRDEKNFVQNMKISLQKLEKEDDKMYTYRLLNKCILYITQNKNMNMTDSEWRDVFHTIVPVAYCDFVLLDKRWTNFIDYTGYSYPNIAKVYNKNEIDNFLNDLDAFVLDRPGLDSAERPEDG